ncbi:MAG TPA: hypothetical protein VM076_04510 [Gemmatimonadaceae bacterium]|nr:hypothetical protein [Gemmatimonadaceae bacterium]
MRTTLHGALLAVFALACSGERPAARPAGHPADDSGGAARAANTRAGGARPPASLDSLVGSLDSAGGFFAADGRSPALLVDARLDVDAFRAAGVPALRRLVDCLGDTATTTTVDDRTDGAVARGTLCYEVLTALVRDSGAAQVPEAAGDALSPSVPAQGLALRRAQRAWRAALAAGKYYWVRDP